MTNITISCGDFYHRGTYQVQNGFQITQTMKGLASNGLELFEWDETLGLLKDTRAVILFPDACRRGNLYAVKLSGLDGKKVYAYRFLEDNVLRMDPYAVEIARVEHKKGEKEKYPATDTYGILRKSSYNWGNDRLPKIPFEESILYGIHVKGFTMDESAHVKHPGTFSGVAQKIPYLKKLGITGIVMQPVYDFAPLLMRPVSGELTTNYWGYTEGNYFAPNHRFAYMADAASELKDMVKAFHRNGMEVIMQLGFPKGVGADFLADILFYWKEYFHMDGFSFVGSQIPVEEIIEKDFLADTKLIAQNLGDYMDSYRPGTNRNPYLAEYRLDFMNVSRRFLKGDEDTVAGFMYLNRQCPDHYHSIHYMADFNTFRMMDLVSYERKHNEVNGEDNKDGENFNNSWNCGAEGDSRKAAVKKLRLKQLKNAACLLFLSQGTPYIFMGDEFGDTSFGNNNPYNQDNAITYVDWNARTRNRSYASFYREMLQLKKELSVLHKASPLKQSDYSGDGIPEISYHGEELWRPNTDSYIRHIGILLSEKDPAVKEKATLYCAYNMHWEEHAFALPALPGKMLWKPVLSTDGCLPHIAEISAEITDELSAERSAVISAEESAGSKRKNVKKTKAKAAPKIKGYRAKIAPRSIVVFRAEPQ